MRILLVEDDVEVARQIEAHLKKLNYVVDLADDAARGEFLGETETYDAIILDLGLPDRDGLLVLEGWRERGVTYPVLILTARGTWREKVAGLRAGADDYLGKPFQLDELTARIEALIRRTSQTPTPVYRCGNILLDPSAARVTLDGSLVELTPLEFRALAYLIRHPGAVVSKSELTEHLYDQDFDKDSNVIEVLVNHLRKKIGADRIRTHRGLGYELASCNDDR